MEVHLVSEVSRLKQANVSLFLKELESGDYFQSNKRTKFKSLVMIELGLNHKEAILDQLDQCLNNNEARVYSTIGILRL